MSQLLFNLSNLDVSGWLRGLIGAGISGGASAVTSGFVVSVNDPDHYGFGSHKFYILVFSVFAASGVVSMAKFLSNTPLPVEKTITTTTAVTKQGEKPPIVTTTVAETHKEIAPGP